MTDAKGYRERQLKEAKDNMQKTKTKSEKSKKEWEAREQVNKILNLMENSTHTTILYIRHVGS